MVQSKKRKGDRDVRERGKRKDERESISLREKLRREKYGEEGDGRRGNFSLRAQKRERKERINKEGGERKRIGYGGWKTSERKHNVYYI